MATSITNYDRVGKGIPVEGGRFGSRIEQRFNCASEKLSSGVVYAAMKLPKGSVVRLVALNVLTAQADKAINIGVCTKKTGTQTTTDAAYASAKSLAAKGISVFDAAVPTAAVALAGTVVVETGALTNVTGSATITTGAWVAGDDDYIVIKPSADITTADFVLTVSIEVFGDLA